MLKGVNRQESGSLRIDKRYIRLHWLIAAIVETEHLQLPLLIPLLASYDRSREWCAISWYTVGSERSRMGATVMSAVLGDAE
jgi:hypothetical protein